MMDFELSPNIDSEKVFLVNLSAIEGRLDSNYNKLSIQVENEFKKSKFPVKRIKSVLNNIQYGTSTLANTEGKGVSIFRMNNIQDDGLSLSKIKYVELMDKERDKLLLNSGDLLFNRTNSKELVGKCSVFRELGEWVYASYIIRVVLDEDILIPEFASAFLNSRLGRRQIESISRQIAGMTNINAEEIKNLRIIIPPIEVQQEAVRIITNAKIEKARIEAQAANLLASIDDYLLNELGISLPEQDNSLEARIFTTSSNKVVGNRLDPKLYTPHSLNLLKAIEAAKYPTVALKKVVVHSIVLPVCRTTSYCF